MSMLFEARNQPIPALFNLRPTQGSVLFLRALGQNEEADILMVEEINAMNELTDLSLTLSLDKLLEYTEVAALTSSKDVHALVRARLIYDGFGWEFEDESAQDRFNIITAVMYRNLAVELRDKSFKERYRGEIPESERTLSFARQYYEKYDAALDGELFYDCESATDVIYEAVKFENKRRKTHQPKLFYPPELIRAGEKFIEYWDMIVSGDLLIDGVDPRWIQILDEVPEAAQYFSQTELAKKILYQYVAKECGVEPEKLRRLEFFRRCYYESQEDALEGAEKSEE